MLMSEVLIHLSSGLWVDLLDIRLYAPLLSKETFVES